MSGTHAPSAGGTAAALAEALGELMWPTRCVGCGEPGALLCPACEARLPWVSQLWACPTCGAPFGWLVCTACDASWDLRVVCALSYEGAARRMVTLLKDAHELRLAPYLAAAIAVALDETQTDLDAIDGICFVPATAEAFARRGFDHMELVARSLSRATGIPVADALARLPAADQRALGREGRQKNLAGSVVVCADVAGARRLLVDVVGTTGASMRACASALLARGASGVMGAAAARVW